MDVMDRRSSIGALIRAYRAAAGWSQRDLAERSGLSLATLRDLEQGRTRRPRLISVQALVSALDLAPGIAASWLSAATETPAVARITRPAPTSAGPVWIGVLGPLAVRRGGADVPLPGGRRRAVLARLAAAAGEAVTVSELIDLLWPGEPPRSAVGAVQSCVSRLRAEVDPDRRDGTLDSVASGYRLRLGEDRSDLVAFRALHRRAGLAGDPSAERGMLGEALELWRGAPLSDVPELRGHSLVTMLGEERVAAALRHADLAAAEGRPELAVPGLRRLAAEHPLHEPVHARLIGALATAGRTADALATFDAVRRRLAEELGLDPGAELASAHGAVLRRNGGGRSAAGPVPAQLPADVARFAGRRGELARMDTFIAEGRRRRGVVVVAITGAAGIGKTTLALRWAHRARTDFPDGQLYADLRGFDPSGAVVSPAAALGRFLHALGASAQRVPAELDAQAALFRSLLADRRMLVVLDNARDDDQVRHLLPGSPGCLVVVTSRDPLTGLVATAGADALPLDLLDAEEARDLLASRLGRARTAAEPEAAAEVVRQCARLPLALAIVAARAASTAGLRLAVLVDELRDQRRRLDALSTGSPAADVRSVLSWSYRLLSPAAGELFRLLGLHPGPEVSVAAAASLAGKAPAAVRPLVAELVRAQLLAEPRPGRFALHDLLRAYAGELALDLQSAAELTAATTRMLDHYLHTALSAALLLNPARRPIAPPPPHPGAVIHQVAGADEALAWFGAEHPVLSAAVAQAAGGFDTHCWQLAWTMWNFLDRRGSWHELLTTQRIALAAAVRRDDATGQAFAHRAIARACAGLDRIDEACEHYEHALDRSSAAGDHLGRATALLGLARMHDHQARPGAALARAEEALTLFPPDSRDIERAWTLNTIGWHRAQLGEHERALAACEEALALLQETDDRYTEAATWDSIGFAHRHLGDRRRAEACYLRAFELYRQLGARYPMAETLTHLGGAHDHFGDRAAARDAYRKALEILDDLSHPGAAELRAKVREEYG